MKGLFAFFSLALLLVAQQTVAPTPESVSPQRGENIGNYNIRQDFETGYRFANVDGNRGKYRSDVNFLNGVRLLGSSLSVFSRDGKDKYFDELVLNAQGLGNDPYQFVSLRLERHRTYRYDMQWRENRYFNPGLTIAFGAHAQDLSRRMQDHQLTVQPWRWLEVYGGFSRNVQDGAALSTVNFFDSRGQIFPLFEDVNRRQDEYRVGGQIKSKWLKFFWQRGWEEFRESTRNFLTSPAVGLAPNVPAVGLNSFQRAQPYSGSTPHWRLNLFTERNSWLAVNARFTHSDGRRGFLFDEVAGATNRGLARNQQSLVAGEARRPVTSANLTFSVFPRSWLTFTNHTAFHSSKIDGDARLQQFINGQADPTLLQFEFLGVRAATNSSVADVVIRPWLSLQGGYQFADRRVRSRQTEVEGTFNLSRAAEQSNRLHAGTLGFRVRPWKGWTIVADGELGRQDRPFLPTSDQNYHGFGLRSEYKAKQFRVAGQMRFHMNFNSANLFQHSSRSRNYTVDATYTPSTKWSLDAGYQKLHLDTITGLAYFLNFDTVEGDRSYFVSNLHAVHAGARLAIFRRLDLYAGLAYSQDTANPDARFLTNTAAQPVFLAAQAFPLTYVSPQVRLSFRLRENVRWNAGYQYYDYSERVLAQQNYLAHTGFLSVLWSF
ncbi:MAG: hypothetical protein OHK0021_11710 [Bryobacter sp.]